MYFGKCVKKGAKKGSKSGSFGPLGDPQNRGHDAKSGPKNVSKVGILSHFLDHF